MKASIIIPALNEAQGIGDTLAAAFAQDYPNFEVIVADNGSTDNTALIAARLGAKVVVEKRKGTMWACEAGRKSAKGDVIVRLDADCLPEKNWLSEGMKHFKNPKVVGVTGPYDYFDGPKTFRFFSLSSQKYVYAPLNAVFNSLHMAAILIGGNSFMRAESLEKMGGFNTDITFYGDDTDVAMRLLPFGKIVFDNKLVMKTSARRFKAQGTTKLAALYVFYFFRTALVAKAPKHRRRAKK